MLVRNMMLTVGLGMTAMAGATTETGSELGLEYAASGHTLAEIYLSNGNTVKFIEVPKLATVFMGEIVPTGSNEVFVLDLVEGDFLQKFLQLTPEHVSVPQKLIDISLSEQQEESDYLGPVDAEKSTLTPMTVEAVLGKQTATLLADRAVTVQLSEPVYMDLSELGIETAPNTKAAGQGSCNNNTGYQYFEDNHCYTIGSQGYGQSEGYCYNGMSSSIQKTSDQAMRTTYTRHATCGSGEGRIRHSRNSASGFFTYFDHNSAANTVETWQSKKSGWAWKRRANFNKLSGSGYVRAWVKYFKEVVQ